jgi:hypothetical protein
MSLSKAVRVFLVAALVWGGLLNGALAATHGLAIAPTPASHDAASHDRGADIDGMGAHHSGHHTEPANDPDCLSYCLEMLDQPYVQIGAPHVLDEIIEGPVEGTSRGPLNRKHDQALAPPRWATGPPLAGRSGSHKIVLTNARLRI